MFYFVPYTYIIRMSQSLLSEFIGGRGTTHEAKHETLIQHCTNVFILYWADDIVIARKSLSFSYY